MDMIWHLIITVLAGTAGGLLMKRLNVPGGLLLGSMLGGALLNIGFGAAYMPSGTKVPVQIVAGAFIGCSMEKSDVLRLPKIIRPAAIMLFFLLVLNLGAGFLIWLVSPLDLLTSLMSVVPGGISDTPIIAADMGADGPKVAVMQLIRQILGIGVFPYLIYLWDRRRQRKERNGSAAGGKDGGRADKPNDKANKEKRVKSKTKSPGAFAVTIGVAALSGIIGRMSGLPSGTFLFAILSVLVLKLVFDFAYIPKWAKKGAQVLSGCYLGSSVGLSDVMELRYLILPVVIIIAGYMLNCFFTGKLISRTCGFSEKEGMLITTPAGASDMALISADLGVENTDVIILQVVRAVVVMTVFPQIISLVVMIAQG